MTPTPPTKQDDLTIIRDALKSLRMIGLNYKWGGGKRRYELANLALEALDRIEKPVQLEMSL